MVDLSQYKIWTEAEFEQAFPSSPSPAKPNGGPAGAQGARGGVSGVGVSADEIDEADLPDDVLEWVRDGVPAGEDRSVVFFKVVKALRKLGYGAEGIFELLGRHPNGIAQKYLDRKQAGSQARLQREVERAYDRPPRAPRPAKAPSPTPPPPVPPAGAIPPSVPGAPTQLAQTTAAYRKWLALADDWAVYVTLGAIAANLLEGKPVWLGIIGPSSSAKTELLNSVSHLPYVYELETVSPAGLLSGSPKKAQAQGATGGVLSKLDKFGVLLFPDFGSVLSLRQESQAEMIAALRRVYDGKYTRRLGVDGGKTLEWKGKAGCLFGATQKYDSHHAIIGTLGDRFVLFRTEVTSDEQMEKCQLGLGERTSVDQELAQAAADLLALLPDPLPAPERMNTTEYAALKQVIRLVIRLRAGVVRDSYRRDIDDVHDPEGPARLILALQQLFAGLVLIGVPRDEACAILQRVAFDSTPRLRLRAFNSLTNEWRSTSEIAAESNLPRVTMKRVLEDLAVQKLALRDDKLKLLPRGKGRISSGDVECWKLTAAAQALCAPKTTPTV
jgi:hypothetical protein